jgi:MFS family permease
MAGNVGIAGGPLATAVLLLAFDWQLVVVILAVPALIATLVGVGIEFDPVAAVGTDADGSRRRTPSSLAGFVDETRRLFTLGFLLVFVIVSFNGLYYRGILTFLPDLLGDFLTAAVGDVRPGIFDPDSPLAAEFDLAQYLYAGLLTVGIAGQYLGGRLTDRIDPDRGLVGMLAVLTLVALSFVPAAATGLRGLLLASFVLGFALFAMQPLTQATIAKYSLPESRGLSFGFTYLAIFGVGALGAAVVGTVLTYASTPVVFVVLAAFSTSAMAVAAVLVRRGREPQPRSRSRPESSRSES